MWCWARDRHEKSLLALSALGGWDLRKYLFNISSVVNAYTSHSNRKKRYGQRRCVSIVEQNLNSIVPFQWRRQFIRAIVSSAYQLYYSSNKATEIIWNNDANERIIQFFIDKWCHFGRSLFHLQSTTFFAISIQRISSLPTAIHNDISRSFRIRRFPFG